MKIVSPNCPLMMIAATFLLLSTIVPSLGFRIPGVLTRFNRNRASLHVQKLSARVMMEVKTLVWLSGVNPLVVVLHKNDQVSKSSLASHLGLASSRLRLAPPASAEDLTGFKIGSIPPTFHTKTMRTVVDYALAKTGNQSQLDCGEGGCLSLEALLQLSHVEVGEVRVGPGEHLEESLEAADVSSTSGEKQFVLPYFPCDMPDWSMDPEASVIDMQDVSVVVRLGSVRKMARKLVFASCSPGGPRAQQISSQLETDIVPGAALNPLTWRCVRDQDPMAVQLIFGKTVVSALGETVGVSALRALKPGQIIYVDGVVGSNKKWGLQNWHTHRCCDVLVRSFSVVQEPPAVQKYLGDPPSAANDRLSRSGVGERAAVNLEHKIPEVFFLTLRDIYGLDPGGGEVVTPLVVNDPQSVELFASTVASLQLPKDASKKACSSWGFDCEWKPSSASNSGETPVELLQLASKGCVFLVDLGSLLEPHKEVGSRMSPLEDKLNGALSSLLQNPAILKVGFSGTIDLRKLAASFPYFTAFAEACSVVDVATLAKALLPGIAKRDLASLSKLSQACLGLPLDKTEQVSDWSHRPFQVSQIEYAALDAASCHQILTVLEEQSNAEAFARLLPRHTSNWRFTILPCDNEDEARRVKGKNMYFGENSSRGRPGTSVWIVSQSWPSSGRSPSPPTARGPLGTYVDKTGELRIAVADLRTAEALAKAASLSGEPGQADGSRGPWVLQLGKHAGKTKDQVLETMIPMEVRLSALPPPLSSLINGEAGHAQGGPVTAVGSAPKIKVEFNPRAGLIECNDADVLFVNIERLSASTRYPNAWGNEGKTISFFIRGNQWKGGTTDLGKRLQGDLAGHSVLLFARSGIRKQAPFVFCGRCRVAHPLPCEGGSDMLSLQLELIDIEALQTSPEFAELMSIQGSELNGGASELAPSPPGSPTVEFHGDDSLGCRVAFQERLAAHVNMGDVAGAIVAAFDDEGTRLSRRSLEGGLACLKIALARSNDPEVLRAVDFLDSAAEKLGLL